MTSGPFRRKPNLLILITDQEREVMHWPHGWAEANLPARRFYEALGGRVVAERAGDGEGRLIVYGWPDLHTLTASGGDGTMP